MTPSRPDVSVCIPVWNGSAFLSDAVSSAIGQSGLSVEVLVGDNASTDGSVEAARRWPAVRVFAFGQHVGMGENWNRLLAEARAPWLLVLPCDDFLEPDALRRAFTASAGHPDTVLVAGAKRVCSRSGRGVFRVRRLPAGRFGKDQLLHRILDSPTNLIGEPGAVLFRRDAWAAAGGFDESLHYFIDVDMWLRLLDKGNLVMLPDLAANFRVHGRSTSFLQAHTIASEFRRFRAKHNGPDRMSLRTLLWLHASVQVRRAATLLLNRA